MPRFPESILMERGVAEDIKITSGNGGMAVYFQTHLKGRSGYWAPSASPPCIWLNFSTQIPRLGKIDKALPPPPTGGA